MLLSRLQVKQQRAGWTITTVAFWKYLLGYEANSGSEAGCKCDKKKPLSDSSRQEETGMTRRKTIISVNSVLW